MHGSFLVMRIWFSRMVMLSKLSLEIYLFLKDDGVKSAASENIWFLWMVVVMP